jgi:hypothetical protein
MITSPSPFSPKNFSRSSSRSFLSRTRIEDPPKANSLEIPLPRYVHVEPEMSFQGSMALSLSFLDARIKAAWLHEGWQHSHQKRIHIDLQ